MRYFEKAFEKSDKDGSRSLTKKEFSHALKTSADVRDALILMELSEVEDLFDKIDMDNSGVMSIPEFVEGVFIAGAKRVRGLPEQLIEVVA